MRSKLAVAVFTTVVLVVSLGVVWSEVLPVGCNSPEPFVMPKSKITVLCVPCGPPGVPQNWWAVKVDGETSFNAPATSTGVPGEFLLPLGKYYPLHPGVNQIEFRAMHVGSGGTISSSTDTINLFWAGPPTPTETPTPEPTPEPTPTETPEIPPTPTPFVQQNTAVEFIGGDE